MPDVPADLRVRVPGWVGGAVHLLPLHDAEEAAAATVGKVGQAREAARAGAAWAAESRADLERASACRTNLAVLVADGDVDEAEFRAALQRVNAEVGRRPRAPEAPRRKATRPSPCQTCGSSWRRRRGLGPAGVAFRDPSRDAARRRRDLLFVPTLGEPVESKRHSIARGTKTRKAKLAKTAAVESRHGR